MVVFSGVYKNYGQNVGTDNLTFQINKGDIFGLLGPNGAGKSTTVKMLVGLLHPDLGSITVNGQPVDPSAAEMKKQIGYKPEAPYLYENLTAREIMHFAAKVKNIASPEREIEKLFGAFALSDRADDLIMTYSHGMKCKTALCLAFIGSPQLIILDEPTNGLDPMSVYNMKELIAEYSRAGATIILSSHILDFVEKICTRFGILDKGQLKALAGPDDLRRENRSLEEFFIAHLKG
ncbi:putative ABC transporter, ATP-binding protein [Candidatus Zixiibacteriota bacterium]|nr:putative ABC transporter, ATP-binding protein [candidate division Zixibacteria bacterium]